MNKPLVSIVIPTYNRAQLLERAVKSVLDQTYANIEILIVDDFSSDRTEKVGKKLEKRHKQVRYIRQAINQGAPAARNRGIREARGEYIGLLDDDDEYLTDKVKLQVEKFQSNPRLGLIYGGFKVIRETSDKEPVDKLPKHRGNIKKALLTNCVIGSPTVLVRKEAFKKVGDFDTKLKSCQDWDMWYRISKQYPIDYVNEVVARYYLHDSDQITTNWSRKVQGAKRIFKKQREDLKKYPKVLMRREQMLVRFLAADGRKREATKLHLKILFKRPLSIRNWKLLALMIFNFKRYRERSQMT